MANLRNAVSIYYDTNFMFRGMWSGEVEFSSGLIKVETVVTLRLTFGKRYTAEHDVASS